MNSSEIQELIDLISGKAISQAVRMSPELQKKLGHSLDDSLLSCTYNNRQCNSSEFMWIFDPIYGNCFVFNADPSRPKQTAISGAWYGLALDFYVNIHERLQLYNAGFKNAKGAILRVDNSSTYTDHQFGGTQVQAGLQTYVAVERAFKSMLPRPYSNCESADLHSDSYLASDLYASIRGTSFAYTQQLCIRQCCQRQLIVDCNCTSPYLNSVYKETRACETKRELNCSDTIWYDKCSSNEFIEATCLPLCPLECARSEYKATLTTAQMMGHVLVGKVRRSSYLARYFGNRTLDDESVAQSVVSVNLFYESLAYTLSSEQPRMDVVALIASLGGHLSLLMGVSVFSVCEIGEVFVEMCLAKVHVINKV